MTRVLAYKYIVQVQIMWKFSEKYDLGTNNQFNDEKCDYYVKYVD